MLEDSGRYGSYAMTGEELRKFCHKEIQAVLSSLRKDGAPFAIPLGYLLDGDAFYVSTGQGRGLVPRLRRDTRVCLTIGGHPVYPTRFVIAEGTAAEVDDPGNEISRRIEASDGVREVFAARNVDVERFFENWSAVGRTVFRIDVHNLVTYDGAKTPRGEKYTTGTGMPDDRRS